MDKEKNTERDKKGKRPYSSPTIDTRDIFEVNALGCAKCPSASNISLSIACIRGTKKFS